MKGWVRECPGAPSPCHTVATALSHFVAHSTLAITITIIIIVMWPIKTGAHQFCRQKFLTHHHLKTDACQGRQAHSTRMQTWHLLCTLPHFILQSLSCAVCDATVATVHLTASCIIMFPDTESALYRWKRISFLEMHQGWLLASDLLGHRSGMQPSENATKWECNQMRMQPSGFQPIFHPLLYFTLCRTAYFKSHLTEVDTIQNVT